MSDLALVQSLFPKVWLPSRPMPLARSSSLVVKSQDIVPVSDSFIQSIDQGWVTAPAVVQMPTNNVSTTQALTTQALTLGPQHKKISALTVEKISKQVQSRPLKSAVILAVEAPEAFHIAAAMIAPGWGLVAHLSPQQSGLPGGDYMMLSNLMSAIRQLLQLSKAPVDFDFFRWPPGRGVAKGLDVQGMGLSALKGFLHKMASQKQCSWLVFDPQFAKFCFQKPEIQELTVLPRGEHHLVVAPSLSQLNSTPELKKQLWLQLKSLIAG